MCIRYHQNLPCRTSKLQCRTVFIVCQCDIICTTVPGQHAEPCQASMHNRAGPACTTVTLHLRCRGGASIPGPCWPGTCVRRPGFAPGHAGPTHTRPCPITHSPTHTRLTTAHSPRIGVKTQAARALLTNRRTETRTAQDRGPRRHPAPGPTMGRNMRTCASWRRGECGTGVLVGTSLANR
jgi:hypothetical protein